MAKTKILFKVELEADTALTIGVLSDALKAFKDAVETALKRARFTKHLTIKSIDWERVVK